MLRGTTVSVGMVMLYSLDFLEAYVFYVYIRSVCIWRGGWGSVLGMSRLRVDVPGLESHQEQGAQTGCRTYPASDSVCKGVLFQG
jgi:hypothetical protein